MKVNLAPGVYVVAVSGGVDSMVLLDVLARLPGLQITVAHFDHGVRSDSHLDRELVQQVAQTLGLPFVFETAQLGPHASEDQARILRYNFLRRVKEQARAEAIITAHHQDDVLETLILNMHRGTGRRGLSSLKSTPEIQRPLLHHTKNELLDYAKEQGLAWREDSTNLSEKYARNYLRLRVMPQISKADRARLLAIQLRMSQLNHEIDEQLEEALAALTTSDGSIVRKKFIMLPHAVAQELMAHILRQNNVRNLSRQLVSRLVIALKTGRPHTMYDVDAERVFELSQHRAILIPRKTRKNA